jgi:hypothetical protein
MGRNEGNSERNYDMKDFEVYLGCTEDYYYIRFTGHDKIMTEDYCYISSFHVLDARLLGLSYPDYLRFCQSRGAKLYGRNGYAYPTWKDKRECQQVCNLIEKEWQKLLKQVKFK